MARYSSRDDEGYRAISSILKTFVRQMPENQQIPSAIPADVAGNASSGALFMVPFSRDDLFIGREDIIAKVSECRAAAPSHTRIAFVGLGGVGKSQIAIEYAHRSRKAEPHVKVVWIHANTPTRFRQGYRDIADKLLLPGREDPSADVLQLVHAWLSDHRNGRWLMILDNVDDDGIFFGDDPDGTTTATGAAPAADRGRPLENFLPQTAHGMILITSRNTIAATNLVGGHGAIVQVEPMGEEDALALLHTRVPFNEPSRADARALVQALGCIPLAISHAGAYIKTRSSTTTISTYLELFRESEANQMHLLSKKEWKDIRQHHSTRHTVIATWHISFNYIQETESSAADLLALMSMFDKQGIPRWLLQGTTSRLDFDNALEPLLSFSFVRTEVGGQALEMHRLVQLSMRRWLEAKNELSKWVNESIQALSAVFPSGRYGTWEQCKVLLPHVKETMNHVTEDDKALKQQAETAENAGRYLLRRAEYTAAKGVLQSSLDIRERVLGPEYPDTLTSIRILGQVLVEQGKYKEAEAMCRRALKGQEKVLGPEHPDTLTSISLLGSALWRQNKSEEAEAMHRRALERQEKVLGREHPGTLGSISELGSVLLGQGKYKEAEVMFRQTLEGREKVLGQEHPETIITVQHLAYLFHRKEHFSTALELYQRAYEGFTKVLGAQHPYTRACFKACEYARQHKRAK